MVVRVAPRRGAEPQVVGRRQQVAVPGEGQRGEHALARIGFPSRTFDLRGQLRSLIYGAISD